MRAYTWITITIIIVLALGLGGTIYFLSRQTDKLRETTSEIGTLREAVSNLQTTLSASQNALKTTKANLAASQDQLRTTQANLAALQDQLRTTQADLASSQANLAALQANLKTVQTDYDSLKGTYNKMATDYSTVSRQLSDIQKVYPLRNFTSYDELNNWVQNHIHPGQTSYGSGALTVQAEAAKDGYLVSASFLYLQDANNPTGTWLFQNTAVAGGALYSWLPWSANTPSRLNIPGLTLVPAQP